MAAKRAGPSSTAAPPSPTSKKVRFDARDPSKLAANDDDDVDEEDLAVLGLDSIGKGGGTTKRSAVNLDGLDSDSDNDNFNTRAADRAKARKKDEKKGGSGKDEDEDEDDDMFGSGDDDAASNKADGDQDDADTAVKRKKTVKFVNNEDILGQEMNSKSLNSAAFDITDQTGNVKEHDTDSESGGDEGRDAIGSDDDERELGAGAKKRHAPRLDAFNMRSEGEEGRFDENGNFVRQTDPNAIHDAWMDGVSKKEMRRAREAAEKREEERRKRRREQDAVLTADLLGVLIRNLDKGESVLEALQRLAKQKPKVKQKPKWQKNKREQQHESAMDANAANQSQAPEEAKRKAAVEAITEAADQLLSRGREEIYDTERELLLRLYKRETGEDWTEHSGNTAGDGDDDDDDDESGTWQFRWLDLRDEGTLHGPYDKPTMQSWSQAGYFANGDVEFRREGRAGWTKVMDFV